MAYYSGLKTVIVDEINTEISGTITPLVNAATNAVGAVLQIVEFGIQPDGGVVDGAWYVNPFLPTNTGYTLLRHWVIGSGTCDVQVNINDVTAYGPYPATTTKDSDAVNITASVGDSVAIQLNNVTGTPTAVFVQLEGLPA